MARQTLPPLLAPSAPLQANAWLKYAGPLLLLLLLSIPALLPLLHPGLPASHDAPFAPYRVYELDRGLRGGIFYPRWAPDFAFGYGYPSFNFYAPLSFYLAEIYHLLGVSLAGGVKLAFATAALGGAVGMYAWIAALLGWRSGIVSAVAYLYLPFHLLTIYSRVDELAEFGATAFFPALLWAAYRLGSSGRRTYLVALALLYAGLICTYNIFALYFTPVLLGYLLVCFASRTGAPRLKVAFQTVAALVLGLAMSCFFWLPALVERQYILSGGLTRGLLDFHHNYLSSGTLIAPSWLFRYDFPASWHDPLPYHLDRFAVLVLLALPLALLLSRRYRFSFPHREGGQGGWPWAQFSFLALFLVVTIWLMLPGSTVTIATVPLAAYIQFPWRLLDFAGLVSSAAYGILLVALEDCGRRFIRPAARSAQHSKWQAALPWFIPALLIALASLPGLPRLQPDFLPLSDSQITPGAINAYEQFTGNIGTSVAAEFLPRWVSEKPTSSELLVGNPATEQIPIDPASLPPGSTLQSSRQRPLAAAVVVDIPDRPALLRFLTFYFPGWQAQVDGHSVQFSPSVPQGFITVAVPAGRHRVTIQFLNTPVRLLASLISWLALGILLLVATWRKRV